MGRELAPGVCLERRRYLSAMFGMGSANDRMARTSSVASGQLSNRSHNIVLTTTSLETTVYLLGPCGSAAQVASSRTVFRESAAYSASRPERHHSGTCSVPSCSTIFQGYYRFSTSSMFGRNRVNLARAFPNCRLTSAEIGFSSRAKERPNTVGTSATRQRWCAAPRRGMARARSAGPFSRPAASRAETRTRP